LGKYILSWCREHAYTTTSDGHRKPLQIFCGLAYGVSEQILSPFSGVGDRTPEEQAWNTDMSKVRIEVEHAFGVVIPHRSAGAGPLMGEHHYPRWNVFSPGVFVADPQAAGRNPTSKEALWMFFQPIKNDDPKLDS